MRKGSGNTDLGEIYSYSLTKQGMTTGRIKEKIVWKGFGNSDGRGIWQPWPVLYPVQFARGLIRQVKPAFSSHHASVTDIDFHPRFCHCVPTCARTSPGQWLHHEWGISSKRTDVNELVYGPLLSPCVIGVGWLTLTLSAFIIVLHGASTQEPPIYLKKIVCLETNDVSHKF